MTPEELKALAESTAKMVTAQVDEKLKAVTDKAKADAEEAARTVAKAMFEEARAARSDVAPVVVVPEGNAVQARHVRLGNHVTKGTGINLARMIKAKAVAAMEHRPVVEVLKGWGDEVVYRALTQGNFGGMGSLVHPEFAGEFIELLRAQAVVRRAGARQVPMGASLSFDRHNAAASAGYVGENDTGEQSEPNTDALLLTERKLKGEVPISNDLMRNPSIQAEEFVRDDIVRVMALREDLAFLFGKGTQFEPLGLFTGLVDPDHVYNETLAQVGAPTFAEMKKEFNKAKKTLKKANAPMLKPVWLFAPQVETAVLDAPGPGAEGTNSLEREMTEREQIRSIPFYTSNQIPTNLDTGNNRTRIGLFDMSEVIIGDSLALEVEVFPNGAYTAGGTVISGISTDRTVVRAISKHDIGMRHRKSGLVIKNVSWGQ